jgi:citrate lyase beta subunit
VAAGQGAATHDGRMIDAASLRMARAILEHRT